MDLYAASRNVTITAEGPSESFFEAPIWGDECNNNATDQERDEGWEDNSEVSQLLPLSVSAGQNITREIFSELRNVGFVIDDKNEPVPDNIPVANTVHDVTNTTIDRNAIAT